MKLTKWILFILLSIVVLSLNACSNKSHENAPMSENVSQKSMEEVEEFAVMNESVSQTSMEDVEDFAVMSERYDEVSHDAKMKSAEQIASPIARKNYSMNFLTSKAADGTLDDNKKFIRTANLRFSVADVVLATHAVEDIIIAKQGFIINSTLTNELIYTNETRVSKDSILVKTRNRLNGTLTLRVPHSFLDAALREIAPLAERIEYRNVNADEVTFRILANNLEQARKKDKAARIKDISGAGNGHKLNDMLAAEESIDNARSSADAAVVAEKEMYDRIEYSTITILLWQDPIATSKMKLREVEIPAYRQGLFARVGDAIASGWYGLLVTIEALLVIWPIWLIVGVIVFAIVYSRKRKKKQMTEE